MDQKFRCALCHTTDNPCVTSCEHHFCYQCLIKWIDDNNPYILCPLENCGHPFRSFTHSGDRLYIIKEIQPGERIPPRRRVKRKPKGLRLSQVPSPNSPSSEEEEEPPSEEDDGLDEARGDHLSSQDGVDGHGDSGSSGWQGRDRGEDPRLTNGNRGERGLEH